MSSIVLKGSTAGSVTIQPPANVTPNITFTLPSDDGIAGQVLATDGSGVLSFITNDGTASFQAANSAGSYANSAFVAANNAIGNTSDIFARTTANTANIHSEAAFAKANTLFNGIADANVDVLTANTITSINIVSSNSLTTNTLTSNNLTVTGTLTVDGVVLQWHTPAPLTSKGDPGDKAGFIAIDNDKIYRCVADYTDGTADIWRYINFTGGTWG